MTPREIISRSGLSWTAVVRVVIYTTAIVGTYFKLHEELDSVALKVDFLTRIVCQRPITDSFCAGPRGNNNTGAP